MKQNWTKLVFALAIAVILVVSSITALVGAGKIVNAVLETYIFGVENCKYNPPIRTMESEVVEQECSIDYNFSKREIADGLAKFTVSFPLALFSFLQIKRKIS